MNKLAVIANPIIDALIKARSIEDNFEYTRKVISIIDNVKTAMHLASHESGEEFNPGLIQIKIMGSISFHDDLLFNEQHFERCDARLGIIFHAHDQVTENQFNTIHESYSLKDVIDPKKILKMFFTADGKYSRALVFYRFRNPDVPSGPTFFNNKEVAALNKIDFPFTTSIGYEVENHHELGYQMSARCLEDFADKIKNEENERKYPTPPKVKRGKK